MLDREKVIRLIEEEISVCESVNQCYRTIDLPALRDILAVIKEQDQMYYTLEHDWRMCRKLLKEQEAVEPKKAPFPDASRSDGSWFYICGACGRAIDPKDKYCRWCGQAMKWEKHDLT